MDAAWQLGAVALAFALGARHAFDADHVAAVFGLVARAERPGRGFAAAVAYSGAHSVVVLALSLAAAVVALRLPPGVGEASRPLVGATLLVLGALVIHRALRGRREPSPKLPPRFRGRGTFVEACSIGLVHGIGYETPTQLAAIGLAVAVVGAVGTALVIAAFALGLLAAHAVLAASAALALRSGRTTTGLRRGLGLAAGAYGIVAGAFILAASWPA